MAPVVQASTKVRSAFEWLADLQRARVSRVSYRTQTARICMRRTDHHTGEDCKAAESYMQAETMRGERSKVTIADVIEKANGDHHPSPQLWARQAQALHLKRAACQCLCQNYATSCHSVLQSRSWPAQLPAVGVLHLKARKAGIV